VSVVAGCGGAARANQVPATSAPISVSRCGLRRRGPQLAGRRLHDGGIVSVVAGCGGAARGGFPPITYSQVTCQSLRAAAARPARGPGPAGRPTRVSVVAGCGGAARLKSSGSQVRPTMCQSLRAAAARPAHSARLCDVCDTWCQSLRAAAARPAPSGSPPATPYRGVSRCGLRRRGPVKSASGSRGCSVSVVAGCGGAARSTRPTSAPHPPRVSRCGLRRRGPRALRGRPGAPRRGVSRCGLRRRGPLRDLSRSVSEKRSVSRCGLRRRGPLSTPDFPRLVNQVSVVAGCGGAARLRTPGGLIHGAL